MKNTREQLISKAMDLFRSEGFGNVTIERICKECDVTKGSFYHHFQSKSDIITSYLAKEQNHYLSIAEKIINVKKASAQLWMVLEHGIDRVAGLGPDIFKHHLLNNINQGFGNTILDFFIGNREDILEYHKLANSIIEKGQADSEIRRKPAKDLSFAFFSGFLGILTGWCVANAAVDIKADAKKLFEVVFISD